MIAGAGLAPRRPRRARPPADRQPVGAVLWASVALLAVLLAYADGFWLVSVQNAVGAIERTPQPLSDWARWSTLLLPVYAAAVLGALLLARRSRPATSARHLLRGVLLATVGATLVGVGALGVSAAYDYHLQSQKLEGVAATHPGGHVHDAGGCDQLCVDKRATLALNARAVGLGGLVELATNGLLVAWVAALRGGRLDTLPAPGQ